MRITGSGFFQLIVWRIRGRRSVAWTRSPSSGRCTARRRNRRRDRHFNEIGIKSGRCGETCLDLFLKSEKFLHAWPGLHTVKMIRDI